MQRAKLQRAKMQRAEVQRAEVQRAEVQRAKLQRAEVQRAACFCTASVLHRNCSGLRAEQSAKPRRAFFLETRRERCLKC